MLIPFGSRSFARSPESPAQAASVDAAPSRPNAVFEFPASVKSIFRDTTTRTNPVYVSSLEASIEAIVEEVKLGGNAGGEYSIGNSQR